ncbi:hypothetical protein B1R94_14420 [Mycolicibacterium litorale]|nr:hypothetical protein B1R94_14420 [Mycolicibacterium litorale]
MVNDIEYVLYWPTELSNAERGELLALYDEVARHEATHGYSGPIADGVGRDLVAADAESLSKGQIRMLLVRDDVGLAGCMTLQLATSPARQHVVHSRRAAVARRSRGGLSPVMAREAIARAVAGGAEVATCEVAADGPVELWKSMGMTEYGVMPDYARRNGRSLDGYFLYMTLPPSTVGFTA